jgi:hypothetical protein
MASILDIQSGGHRQRFTRKVATLLQQRSRGAFGVSLRDEYPTNARKRQ